MTKSAFLKIKNILDTTIDKLIQESLANNINISSPDFLGFLEKIKEKILTDNKIDINEYLELENQYSNYRIPQAVLKDKMLDINNKISQTEEQIVLLGNLTTIKDEFKKELLTNINNISGSIPTQEAIALIAQKEASNAIGKLKIYPPTDISGIQKALITQNEMINNLSYELSLTKDELAKWDNSRIAGQPSEELTPRMAEQIVALVQGNKESNQTILSKELQEYMDKNWGLFRTRKHSQPTAEWSYHEADSRYYTKGQVDAAVAAAGGGGVEIPVGDVNGVNVTYTVSNTPKFLTVDGQAIYENYGYTLSTLTITMENAPLTGQILRSHY